MILCRYGPRVTPSLDPLYGPSLWHNGGGRKEGHIIELFLIICKLFLGNLRHDPLQKAPSVFPSVIMWWVSSIIQSLSVPVIGARQQNLLQVCQAILARRKLIGRGQKPPLSYFRSTLSVPSCRWNHSPSVLTKTRPG